MYCLVNLGSCRFVSVQKSNPTTRRQHVRGQHVVVVDALLLARNLYISANTELAWFSSCSPSCAWLASCFLPVSLSWLSSWLLFASPFCTVKPHDLGPYLCSNSCKAGLQSPPQDTNSFAKSTSLCCSAGPRKQSDMRNTHMHKHVFALRLQSATGLWSSEYHLSHLHSAGHQNSACALALQSAPKCNRRTASSMSMAATASSSCSSSSQVGCSAWLGLNDLQYR